MEVFRGFQNDDDDVTMYYCNMGIERIGDQPRTEWAIYTYVNNIIHIASIMLRRFATWCFHHSAMSKRRLVQNVIEF